MKDGKPAFMTGKKMMHGGMTHKFAHGGGIESRGKTKGTVIRMAAGGMPPQGMPTRGARPQGMSNAGGAMRGLNRAAAMSSRPMPTMGRPAGMKHGGSVSSRADGIAQRGKTRA
jgi:hypothetical protein